MAAIEENREVEIILKAIGLVNPARSYSPPSSRLVAGERGLPADRLKLVLRGNILHDKKNGRDDGDDLLVKLDKPGRAARPPRGAGRPPKGAGSGVFRPHKEDHRWLRGG